MITRMLEVVSYRVDWITIAGSMYTRWNTQGVAILGCVVGAPVRLRERAAAGTFLSMYRMWYCCVGGGTVCTPL